MIGIEDQVRVPLGTGHEPFSDLCLNLWVGNRWVAHDISFLGAFRSRRQSDDRSANANRLVQPSVQHAQHLIDIKIEHLG